MTYVVLARKWRPQTFEEVVGQEHVTRTLKNAITLNRVHHAFLFTGARGVGKTSIARILAKALNCETGPTVTPCGECASCKEIVGGTSMDVFEIDGASNRGINEIRELRESVRYQPSRDRHKIYIIDEVHMLTTEAFNALLKTLEEPPSHVSFIFATTEPERVPVTIQSRCQRFDFKRLPIDQVKLQLESILKAEGVSIEDDALFLISRESEGSMRDAQSLLDQVIAFAGESITLDQVTSILGITDRRSLHQLLSALVNRDVTNALTVLKEVYQYGIGTRELANQLLDSMRDLLVIKTCRDSRSLTGLTTSEWEGYNTLAAEIETTRLERMFDLLLSACSDIARSPFPRLILELALIRASRVPPIQSVADLLDKLEQMERRLAGKSQADGPAVSAPADTAGRNSVRSQAPLTSSAQSGAPRRGHPVKQQPDSRPPAQKTAPLQQKPEQKRTPEPQAAASAQRPAQSGPFEWERFVERVKEKSRRLGAILEHAQFISYSANTLEVAPEEGFQTMLADQSNRGQIEKELKSFAGMESTIVVSDRPDPEAHSISQIKEQQRQERLQAKRQSIENDPLIQSGVNAVFPDAELLSVKATLQEES